MSDWKVGDVAVRVSGFAGGIPGAPRKGMAVHVDGIWISPKTGRAGLIFNGYPGKNAWRCGWVADCFRKVVSDEREACEPEFVTLLKRSKRKVEA